MDSRTEKVIKLMELLGVDFNIHDEFKTDSQDKEKHGGDQLRINVEARKE